MRFFELLSGLLGAVDDNERRALRTLCCGAVMYDLWMHERDCPNLSASLDKMRDWQAANPKAPLDKMPSFVPPLGDRTTLCPHCGFPTQRPNRVYVVGQKCPYCGYVEKRTR